MAKKNKDQNAPPITIIGKSERIPLPKPKYEGKINEEREFRTSRIRLAKMAYSDTGVPNRLKQVRENAGKTQAEMAEIFNITQPYYSTFEDGERMLTAPMLMVLIKEGFSSDYILVGKGTALYSESKVNNTEFELLKKENDHLKSENDFLKKQVADFMEVLKRNK